MAQSKVSARPPVFLSLATSKQHGQTDRGEQQGRSFGHGRAGRELVDRTEVRLPIGQVVRIVCGAKAALPGEKIAAVDIEIKVEIAR